MSGVGSVTLDVPDAAAARDFYSALGLGDRVDVREGGTAGTGFRAFTLSLVVSQPSTVDALAGTAVDGGAATVKPVTKSFWGYGGVVRAPDGALLKIASSSKKDSGPTTREIDDVVLLLGVADTRASKRFYVGRGLVVDKSYGSRYVQFTRPGPEVTLALYGRRALAKDAGVASDGDGGHGLVIAGDAGEFTDPDGFAWAVTEKNRAGAQESRVVAEENGSA